MTDELEEVRAHYGAVGLMQRLKAALAAFGRESQELQPKNLATLDQFHTRGLAATADLAKLAKITDETSVLDIGSGLGGPARFLAESYGCDRDHRRRDCHATHRRPTRRLSYYSWVFSAFLLAQSATTPIYGKLSDMFGRKPVLNVVNYGEFMDGQKGPR